MIKWQIPFCMLFSPFLMVFDLLVIVLEIEFTLMAAIQIFSNCWQFDDVYWWNQLKLKWILMHRQPRRTWIFSKGSFNEARWLFFLKNLVKFKEIKIPKNSFLWTQFWANQILKSLILHVKYFIDEKQTLNSNDVTKIFFKSFFLSKQKFLALKAE